MLAKLIGAVEQLGPATAVAGGGPDIAGMQLRSMAYPLYFYVAAQTPLGPAGPAILQTWMTLFVLLAFLPTGALARDTLAVGGTGARPAWIAALAFAGLATVTTLPWIASYAMPTWWSPC